MSDTFCSLPWVHLATHPHSQVTLCCEAEQHNSESAAFDVNRETGGKRFKTLNSTAYDFKDLMNNDNFNQVRLDMLAGKEHPACKKCYRYERNNLESKRVREGKRISFGPEDAKKITDEHGNLSEVQYEFIELRLGNHCNIACRTCNPMSSSRWVSDWKKLGFEWDQDKELFDWPLDEKFWSSLENHSQNLKYIYINGGEPLLVDKHAAYLQYLVDSGLSKNITLQYSTNVTVTNDIYIDLWKEFKHVELMMSIDDLYERNNYTRYPSKWSVIEKNLNWFLDIKKNNVANPIVCQSISILNAYHLDDFWNYFRELGLGVIHNYVIHPHYYSIVNLPPHIKDMLTEKFNATEFGKSFEDFVYSKEQDADQYIKFLEETKKLDIIRKQNFLDSNPDMATLIGKELWQ